MSKGALHRERFEAIEAYVLDRMNADERTAFEHRMANDAALRRELELARENIRAVELGGVTRVLQEMRAQEGSGGGMGGRMSHYLKYAAVIAALVIGATWWITRTPAHERLFAEHFVADPGLPVAMGASADPAFADAMVSYKEGLYAEARAKWAPLLQAEPANDTLRFYIANTWLAGGDAMAAIPLLEGLVDEPGSAFRTKARWFLLLAYVKAGDAEKARAIPLDGDPLYGERVRDIKARLKP